MTKQKNRDAMQKGIALSPRLSGICPFCYERLRFTVAERKGGNITCLACKNTFDIQTVENLKFSPFTEGKCPHCKSELEFSNVTRAGIPTKCPDCDGEFLIDDVLDGISNKVTEARIIKSMNTSVQKSVSNINGVICSDVTCMNKGRVIGVFLLCHLVAYILLGIIFGGSFVGSYLVISIRVFVEMAILLAIFSRGGNIKFRTRKTLLIVTSLLILFYCLSIYNDIQEYILLLKYEHLFVSPSEIGNISLMRFVFRVSDSFKEYIALFVNASILWNLERWISRAKK